MLRNYNYANIKQTLLAPQLIPKCLHSIRAYCQTNLLRTTGVGKEPKYTSHHIVYFIK